MEDNAPAILPEKKVYTPEEILSLRRAGLPKPLDVAWADWRGPSKLSGNHELVAYMAASGTSKQAISEAVGMTLANLRVILAGERMKFRIKEIQFNLYGHEPKKRFEALLDKSVQVVSDILEDEGVKASVRLSAAREVADRVMGKPTQHIETKDATLLDFYEKLETVFSKKDEDSIEAEYSEVLDKKIEEIEIKEKDAVDKWVEENL
jgi:hypothetical protein